MSCQDLQSSLTTAARPEGATESAPRPSGMLRSAARMVGDGICRVFTLPPPAEAGRPMQTFAGDQIQTFGGENLVTLG